MSQDDIIDELTTIIDGCKDTLTTFHLRKYSQNSYAVGYECGQRDCAEYILGLLASDEKED